MTSCSVRLGKGLDIDYRYINTDFSGPHKLEHHFAAAFHTAVSNRRKVEGKDAAPRSKSI